MIFVENLKEALFFIICFSNNNYLFKVIIKTKNSIMIILIILKY